MTTQFKSPRSGITVAALISLGAAAGATSKLTSEVVAGQSLTELTRHLVAHPSDEAALSAVCVALRDGAKVEELVALLEMCSNAKQGESLPDHALAELSFRIAKGATGMHARELCRTALDLCPVHGAALALFEDLADASWTDELCARYQIFLEDAPAHGVAPDVCEIVTNKLVQTERAARALARAACEIDSVAEWQCGAVLSMQA